MSQQDRYYRCDGKINIVKLLVLNMMLSTSVTASKFILKLDNYVKCGEIQPITITENNVLIDGYIDLLIALKHGIVYIPYIRSNFKKKIDETKVTRASEINPNKIRLSGSTVKSLGEIAINPNKAIKVDYSIIKETRQQQLEKLLEKQEYKCYICNRKITLNKKKKRTECEIATQCHLIPIAIGGSDKISNIALCCPRCVQLKGSLAMVPQLKEIISEQRDREESILGKR